MLVSSTPQQGVWSQEGICQPVTTRSEASCPPALSDAQQALCTGRDSWLLLLLRCTAVRLLSFWDILTPDSSLAIFFDFFQLLLKCNYREAKSVLKKIALHSLVLLHFSFYP